MLLKVFLIMIFLGVCGFRYNAPLHPQISFSKHNTQELQTRLAHLMLQLQDEYHFTNMELSINSANITNENIDLYYNNQTHQILKISNDHHDLFQIGSISKTFTAFIILKLVREQKNIKLDDSITKFLPQYPNWHNITIRQLLNQTSGIPDYTDSSFWWLRLYLFPNRIWHADELIDIAYNAKQSNAGWNYSNTNYVLLGMIAEKVYHHSFKEFFDTSGLSLQNTYYSTNNLSQDLQIRLVPGHNQWGLYTPNINLSWLQSSGAILSNALDIAKWYSYYADFIADNPEYQKLFIDINTMPSDPMFNNDGYGVAMFSKKYKNNLIWFTPGYTAMGGYVVNKKVSFAYVINKHLLGQNTQAKILPQINDIISQL